MFAVCYVNRNLASKCSRLLGHPDTLKIVLELTSHRHDRGTLLHESAVHEPDAVVERYNSSEHFVAFTELRPDQDDDVYSGADGNEGDQDQNPYVRFEWSQQAGTRGRLRRTLHHDDPVGLVQTSRPVHQVVHFMEHGQKCCSHVDFLYREMISARSG